MQQVRGVEAAGAELVRHAVVAAGGGEVGGLRRVVPVQRGVVAQLEQVDVPGGRLGDDLGERVSGRGAVSCHCQKKL